MISIAWERLIDTIPTYTRRLEQRFLEKLRVEFSAWLLHPGRIALQSGKSDERLALCDFLAETIATDNRGVEEVRRRHSEFVRMQAQISTEEESTRQLLDYAKALGADDRQLAADEAALQRWFGADALTDRMQARLSNLERRIALALSLLGRQARTLLEEYKSDAAIELWRRLAIETIVRGLFAFEGHPRVKLEAFCCLANTLCGLPADKREGAVGDGTVQFIYRCAMEARQPLWLQVEALDLLRTLAPSSFLEIARLRLTRPHGGDDFFLRRRVLLLAIEVLAIMPDAATLLPLGLADSSPYVRQSLAKALTEVPADLAANYLPRLLLDEVPQVRAQALLTLGERLIAGGDQLPLPEWLCECLAEETEPFVLRTGLLVVEQILAGAIGSLRLAAALDNLKSAVFHLHQTSPYLQVRRWAAATGRTFALHADPSLADLVRRLATVVEDCPPGGRKRLPKELNDVSAERLGCAAVFLVRADYGLDFERSFGGWYVHRGHRFGFRFWRWLHELRHPSPDKRQAFCHTDGRIFGGDVRVPSPILAELAQTKVPGEPLHMSCEGGWRPYLPLPDELLSSLDRPRSRSPLRIFSAEGITSVQPPASPLKRLFMRMRLSTRFVDYARARNWVEGSQHSADHYVRLLQETGFKVSFTPHADGVADPAVTRFFPAGFGLLGMGGNGDELWRNFENYFFSAYGNTLFDLAIFVTLGITAFTIHHLYGNWRMRKARRNIPLVIGGWGTRGKSGTERLKAALFNGMGYSVVSKTTGCEAMFLHSRSHQPLREMFLFRPYDKATIWEQQHVTHLAHELEADVMLWECMALTPEFVELLQKRWMRDDLSTITNTFPDHEDLQGPAGINIPQVMTHFIPRKSTLITSEEQMRPILATAAAKLGTRLEGVGWLESGLLTPDVLERFPYREHPDNIALVIRMAAELGVDEDFVLKEIADRVVPDLGVLKVYPEAMLSQRSLSFANGMSANERFGCLDNWVRLGFNNIDVDAEPATLVCTVVNNRADRVARSRVFAGILVEDISADLHFLIGSNLEGIVGYIEEAWQEHVTELTLWPEDDNQPSLVLEHQARRMRVPFTVVRVKARLAAMLTPYGLANDAELLNLWQESSALKSALNERNVTNVAEIISFHESAVAALREYEEFAARVAKAGPTREATLDAAFHALLWRWFERKLVIINDYHASGDKLVQLIAAQTPPGFHNRLMGVQNIKGTGLDFVYRWQAWGACHTACAGLRNGDGPTFRRSLATLGIFQEYGLLCEEHVRETIAIASQSPHAQSEWVQAELAQIGVNLDHAIRALREKLGATVDQGWLESAVFMMEGFVDALDAIRRRRIANKIYVDLTAQRISHTRAAIELLKLTQRQKGGWLYPQLRERFVVWGEVVEDTRQRVSRFIALFTPNRSKSRVTDSFEKGAKQGG
ncbi:MAG: hypothetical protein V4568_09045 [Pseudomonadota bacterium]